MWSQFLIYDISQNDVTEHKTRYFHSKNGTIVAVGRIMCNISEKRIPKKFLRCIMMCMVEYVCKSIDFSSRICCFRVEIEHLVSLLRTPHQKRHRIEKVSYYTNRIMIFIQYSTKSNSNIHIFLLLTNCLPIVQ